MAVEGERPCVFDFRSRRSAAERAPETSRWLHHHKWDELRMSRRLRGRGDYGEPAGHTVTRPKRCSGRVVKA